MKLLKIFSYIISIALCLTLIIYLWYIALIFVVVGLHSLFSEKYKTNIAIKLAFVALYFVSFIAISSLFRTFGIEPVPHIQDSNECANGYVCY